MQRAHRPLAATSTHCAWPFPCTALAMPMHVPKLYSQDPGHDLHALLLHVRLH